MRRSSSLTLDEAAWMRRALRLARRAYGCTSPNPMVGAVLVKEGRRIGQGWHHRAGAPHAEIEALRDAQAHGHSPSGATLFVTLEPCSTFGRTPPCTEAIVASGIRQVVVAATDPNPAHAGRAFAMLAQSGIRVTPGVLADEANVLNEPFNYWIVHKLPHVTVKAAMSLDGKIATATGESRWITSEKARAVGMKLRQGADAILVGINTVLADDPQLTVRTASGRVGKALRRIVLDSSARVPLESKIISDEHAEWTTVVVSRNAPSGRVAALEKRVGVLRAPERDGRIDLRWLLRQLGRESVLSLLVEGGGTVNASFLLGGFAQRFMFFYAPLMIGGAQAPTGVGGDGVRKLARALAVRDVVWRRVGPDLMLTGRLAPGHAAHPKA